MYAHNVEILILGYKTKIVRKMDFIFFIYTNSKCYKQSALYKKTHTTTTKYDRFKWINKMFVFTRLFDMQNKWNLKMPLKHFLSIYILNHKIYQQKKKLQKHWLIEYILNGLYWNRMVFTRRTHTKFNIPKIYILMDWNQVKRIWIIKKKNYVKVTYKL